VIRHRNPTASLQDGFILRSLTSAQRKKVISSESKAGDDFKAGAGQDNAQIAYQGLAAGNWTGTQRGNLPDLVRVYVGTPSSAPPTAATTASTSSSCTWRPATEPVRCGGYGHSSSRAQPVSSRR
jgi:hypothetical protein